MMLTNSYILYLKYHHMHDNGDNVLSHYDYIKQISMAWIDPDRYWPNKKRSKRKRGTTPVRRSVRLEDSSDDDESMSTATSATSTRCQPIDAAALHPISGSLNVRLNTAIQHLPVHITTKKSRCQLHRWARGRGKGAQSVMSGVIMCSVCRVSLCVKCYNIYHKVANVVDNE